MPTAAEQPGLLFLMARSNTFMLRAAWSAAVEDVEGDGLADNRVEASSVNPVRAQAHNSITATKAGRVRMR